MTLQPAQRDQEQEKMITEALRQQPIERTVTILADDYDGLKTICRHYREKCQSKDEILNALKSLVTARDFTELVAANKTAKTILEREGIEVDPEIWYFL